MPHNFKDSLIKGKIGETQFFSKYSKELKLILKDGFKEDFTMGKDKEMVELKSDSYSMAKTENFFMERYSDKDKQSPGGPWQSLNKDINHFIYYYINDDVYYLFDTKQLVKRLEKIVPTLKPVNILNRGWVTMGYKVPRSLLEDLNKRKTKKC